MPTDNTTPSINSGFTPFEDSFHQEMMKRGLIKAMPTGRDPYFSPIHDFPEHLKAKIPAPVVERDTPPPVDAAPLPHDGSNAILDHIPDAPVNLDPLKNHTGKSTWDDGTPITEFQGVKLTADKQAAADKAEADATHLGVDDQIKRDDLTFKEKDAERKHKVDNQKNYIALRGMESRSNNAKAAIHAGLTKAQWSILAANNRNSANLQSREGIAKMQQEGDDRRANLNADTRIQTTQMGITGRKDLLKEKDILAGIGGDGIDKNEITLENRGNKLRTQMDALVKPGKAKKIAVHQGQPGYDDIPHSTTEAAGSVRYANGHESPKVKLLPNGNIDPSYGTPEDRQMWEKYHEQYTENNNILWRHNHHNGGSGNGQVTHPGKASMGGYNDNNYTPGTSIPTPHLQNTEYGDGSARVINADYHENTDTGSDVLDWQQHMIHAGLAVMNTSPLPRFGCARGVCQIAKIGGMPLPHDDSARGLEEKIQASGKFMPVHDGRILPGDIIFMKGSGPSGRHVGFSLGLNKHGVPVMMHDPGGTHGNFMQPAYVPHGSDVRIYRSREHAPSILVRASVGHGMHSQLHAVGGDPNQLVPNPNGYGYVPRKDLAYWQSQARTRRNV